MFSVLDATKGFWQLRLDKESSKLLFNTYFGRYRYLCLPFGVSPAPEIYQRKMHEMFDDIKGVEWLWTTFWYMVAPILNMMLG